MTVGVRGLAAAALFILVAVCGCDGGGPAGPSTDAATDAAAIPDATSPICTDEGEPGAIFGCTVLWVVRDAEPCTGLGHSLAGEVDLDGDGVMDVLAGAPSEPHPGGGAAGAAYVYSGVDGEELLAVTVEGAAPGLGEEVAWVGERDGDGVPDLALATGSGPFCEATPSAVYVVAGAGGTVLATLDGTMPGDCQGGSLAAAGDVDGDALADLLVGAPGDGRVILYAGAPLAPLWQIGGTAFPGLGRNLTVTGDANGGGEVIVSSVPLSAFTDVTVDAFDLATGAPRWSAVRGPYTSFGSALATLGDADGDGVEDVLVGAAGSRAVEVVSGAGGASLWTLAAPLPGYFGAVVARVGDFDGDTLSDVAVGSWADHRVLLVSGATGALLKTIVAAAPGDWLLFGSAVAAAGDLDGDALPDLFVGAPGEGAVYALSCAL